MILDRDKEKKTHGKATHHDDICRKLKDLDLRGSESSKEKLKITDNFPKMNNFMQNDFGDEAIKNIGEQFRQIKIVEEGYNFPSPKKIESLDKKELNIVCDNKIQDNKHKKGRNINFDEEHTLPNENENENENEKAPDPDVGQKKRDLEEKLKPDKSSLRENEVKKEIKVDKSAESKYNKSEVSKKTEVLSRGPVSQKLFQPTFEPYTTTKTCSRSHHSGGKLRVQEQPTWQTQQSLNNCHLWNDIPGLNIMSNEQQQCAPPVQMSNFQANGRQPDTNIPSGGSELSGEDIALLEELMRFPIVGEFCDLLNETNNTMRPVTGGDIIRKKEEEYLASSPGDSATSSLGSPGSIYQPGRCSSDSGLDSPPHGVEYLMEPFQTQNENTVEHGSTEHFQRWISNVPIAQFPSECHQAEQTWKDQPPTLERPNSRGKQRLLEGKQAPSQGKQTVHERPPSQGKPIILDTPLPQNRQRVQEGSFTQSRQMLQEGSQIVQGGPPLTTTIQGGQLVQKTSVPQGPHISQETQRVNGSPQGGRRYVKILPAPRNEPPAISTSTSAKERFQQILDMDRKLSAWLNVAKTLMVDPKKFETQDAEGDTDLMIMCCNKSSIQLEMIYAMVEKMRHVPNSLGLRNHQGHSALYMACKVLHEVPVVAAYIAEALLEQNLDLSKMTFDGGLTLIQIIEKKGDTHKNVLQELLALKDSSGKNVFQTSGTDMNANNFRAFK